MSAWAAYVAAQQAAHEAATKCAGSPGDGRPKGTGPHSCSTPRIWRGRSSRPLRWRSRRRSDGVREERDLGAGPAAQRTTPSDQARARARAAGATGRDPGLEPPLRRVILPVSRAPRTGWQNRAACRTSPPEWFDAGSDADASRRWRYVRAARCARSAFSPLPPTVRSQVSGWRRPVRGGPGGGQGGRVVTDSSHDRIRALDAEPEECHWGPGGRAHFADRGREISLTVKPKQEAEKELEAG